MNIPLGPVNSELVRFTESPKDALDPNEINAFGSVAFFKRVTMEKDGR